MGDMKHLESLQPGQGQAGLTEGGTPQLGASHEQNSGTGEARDLGPDDVGKMFGPAVTPLERLRMAGMVDESNPAEMGGGEPVDPVENHFKNVRLDRIQEFIAEQQGKNYPDTSSIKLSDGTSISFGEYKKIATAVKIGADKGKSVEQLVREARQWILPRQEKQHQSEIEKILNLDSARQRNKGESVAVNFLTELKETLASRYGNDLEKQSATLRNLYNQLRKDDALGFSPDIELIPPGADISTLLSLLKSMFQGNGG